MFRGEKGCFCWGFCHFVVFCCGEIVVCLWWNAWSLWCFVWWFFAAENMPTFWNLFLGFPVLGNGSVKEGILQGLKPLSCQATDAKPEGLAYLEAKATAACPFRMAVWARFALSLDGPLMR
jgi:hypothetical protein